MFGRVAETTAGRGEFFLFYSYTHVCGCGPILYAVHLPWSSAYDQRNKVKTLM